MSNAFGLLDTGTDPMKKNKKLHAEPTGKGSVNNFPVPVTIDNRKRVFIIFPGKKQINGGEAIKIELERDGIKLIPESDLEIAFVEDTLGLKKNGDSIRLTRKSSYSQVAEGIETLEYLRTEVEEE